MWCLLPNTVTGCDPYECELWELLDWSSWDGETRQVGGSLGAHTQIQPRPLSRTGLGCPKRLSCQVGCGFQFFSSMFNLGSNQGDLSPSAVIWTPVPGLVHSEPQSGLSPCSSLQPPREREPSGTPSEAVAPWRPPLSPQFCRFIHLLQLDSLWRADLGAQGSVFSSAVLSTTCGPS